MRRGIEAFEILDQEKNWRDWFDAEDNERISHGEAFKMMLAALGEARGRSPLDADMTARQVFARCSTLMVTRGTTRRMIEEMWP